MQNILQLGTRDIRRYLSIFGKPKRIPLSIVLMDIEEDGTVRKAQSLWPITEKDVRDHFGTLQGVLIIEAALQTIICVVEEQNLFPDHEPAFVGIDAFRIFSPVRAGEGLKILLEEIRWKGKKGSATMSAWCNEKKVASGVLAVRANSEKVLKRIGFEKAA